MHHGRINPLSKEEIEAIFRKFGWDKQEGDYDMEGTNGEIYVEISKLKPHPQNENIYGNENVSDLVVQIKAYGGIADPLKIKEDYTIISGHRRWKAARELGLTKVPCHFVSYDSKEDELAALVMFNYQRTKTNEQKAREGMVLEEALKAEGMERKFRALKQNQSDRDPGSPTDTLGESSDSLNDSDEKRKKGRTRDIVADAVKIGSGKNYERMKKVILATDKFKSEGKTDDADFLLQMMDKSVKPACNLLDAGYASLPDEERERIRKGGKEVIRQYVAKQPNEAKPKVSFKKIMKNLSIAEQILTDAVQTVDSFDDVENSELMEKLNAIKMALVTVNAKMGKPE